LEQNARIDGSSHPEARGVAAVERAFAVLSAFRSGDRGLTLAELAARTGLYKSTILRLCESLIRHSYLQRLDDGRYQIGPAPFMLGALYQRSLRVSDIIPPILRELAEQTGEGVSFYTLQGDARVCLFKVDSKHSIRQHEHEGDVLPLDRGSSGRVLAAFSGMASELSEMTRRQHYYISIGDRDPDLVGISTPVFGAGQRLIGALTLGGPRTRVSPELLLEARSTMLKASIRATVSLGGNSDSLMAAVERAQVEHGRADGTEAR
jgi:DNA-binding IclR family transcriptional regulator